MSEREEYRPGVRCRVESLQPDPRAAAGFYRPLFGREVAGRVPMSDDPPGTCFVARVKGRDVAGIGSLPDSEGPPRPGPPPGELSLATRIAVAEPPSDDELAALRELILR